MKNIGMKYATRLILKGCAAIVFGAAICASSVSAQNARVFEVEVPFDFVVMGQKYDAATYRIGRLNQASPDTLVLNSASGKTLAIIQTHRLTTDQPAEFTTLKFRRQGEANFLESVITSGDSHESRLTLGRTNRRTYMLARATQVVSLVVK